MNVKARAKFMELYGPITGSGTDGSHYDYYRVSYWIDNATASFSVSNVDTNREFISYLRSLKWGSDVDVYLRVTKSKKTNNWYVNLDPKF